MCLRFFLSDNWCERLQHFLLAFGLGFHSVESVAQFGSVVLDAVCFVVKSLRLPFPKKFEQFLGDPYAKSLRAFGDSQPTVVCACITSNLDVPNDARSIISRSKVSTTNNRHACRVDIGPRNRLRHLPDQELLLLVWASGREQRKSAWGGRLALSRTSKALRRLVLRFGGSSVFPARTFSTAARWEAVNSP